MPSGTRLFLSFSNKSIKSPTETLELTLLNFLPPMVRLRLPVASLRETALPRLGESAPLSRATVPLLLARHLVLRHRRVLSSDPTTPPGASPSGPAPTGAASRDGSARGRGSSRGGRVACGGSSRGGSARGGTTPRGGRESARGRGLASGRGMRGGRGSTLTTVVTPAATRSVSRIPNAKTL